jgi:hypothetical protein
MDSPADARRFRNALRGAGPQARIGLTDAGRRALIELVAAAKSVEAHAERNLGTAEIRALKRALRAIISETDPGAPPRG